MPTDRDFAAAAAWLTAEWHDNNVAEVRAHATLARDCVRAMAALASGEVGAMRSDDDRWQAWVIGTNIFVTTPDPLTAILAALDAQEAPRA